MLLMYLDLISSGMNQVLATQFYEQMRCLSRSNIYPAPELKAWEVCFSFDFSAVVGNLLAKYVHRDVDPETKQETLPNTSRFIFGRSRRRATFLRSLFGNSRTFRRYAVVLEDACCRRCSHSRYFVNIEKGECLRDPFGLHCCHVACKALGRLKVGASRAISFCCRNCRPQRCAR